MNVRSTTCCCRSLLAGLLSLQLLAGLAFSQGFSGSGRGFGSRGSRGLLRELQNEEVRAELKMTPEQQQKLEALVESQRDNRDKFSDIFQRYASAKSEEERNLVREQMMARFTELRKAADADAKSILEPAQASRLEQLHLHHEGPAIFVWDADLATEFGITEEQKKELATFGEQRMMARLALGRNASPEERMKVNDEWQARSLNILTPDQQKKWAERIGPPPVVTDASTVRATAPSPSAAEAAASAKTPMDSPATLPAGTSSKDTATKQTVPASMPPASATTPAEAPANSSAPASPTPAPAVVNAGAPVPVRDQATGQTPTATPSSENAPVMTLQPPVEPVEPIATFRGPAEGRVNKSQAGSAQGQSNTAASPGEKKLSFNFRYAPWGEVLKLFAEEAGLSLDLNALPPGTFNYYDKNSYTPTEALDILNGYLLPKGYCLLRRDDFLVCVNIDDPIPPSLIPNVSPDELDQRGRNELLTVIFPLEGVDVSQVASEVNDIKGPQGKVVGLKSTNSVLVTDIGSNLIRIHDLLRDVTSRGGPDDITFKSYQVKHIDVIDAEQIVRTLLGVSPRVANVSSVNEPRGGRGRGDSRSRRFQQQPPPPSPAEPENSPVRVATDTRTNQLLVTATLAQHLLVEQALKTIDLDADSGQFTPSANRPFLKVYQVTAADPREVTKTIDALIPGVVVNEDARNGKIHIQATPDQHRQVETLIAQMDGLGGDRQMAVIPLSRLDPVSVTTTLRSMFMKDGDTAPIIEPDYYGQQLMIRASAEQITQIRTLLTQLGEDGTSRRGAANNSMARTIPLAGRDPAELLPLIQKMWKANNSAPLRIVTPPGQKNSDSTQSAPPARSENAEAAPPQTRILTPGRIPTLQMAPRSSHHVPIRTAAQSAPVEESQPPSTASPAPPLDPAPAAPSEKSELDQLLDAYLDGIPPESPPPSQNPSVAEKPASGAEINIVLNGDEIFATSSDPEQLNQFEELLAQTMQAIPPRVTWTVFTLRVADATEAANMLKLLFPGSSVAAATSSTSSMLDSFSSGVTSLGSSLSDITGLGSGASQTLKIIPDNRQNALFVTGPAAQVREVEEMLKVLDATDLGGDSLRDKVARLIPVQHASVDEVFTIVKDVYKSYIDPPRVQENNNPFAMLGGGGQRGRGNEAPPPAPKLAIGVDKSTSHLIVWADDALFQEVEALVESIDVAAQEARRTVRVVNLENTNSLVVQGALGSLMPQVKVSVTGSRQTPGTTSPSPPATSGTSSNNTSSSDQMRQFFEQRMRERMQGGERGRGSFGRGRGGFGGGDRGSGGGRGSRGGN